MVRKVLEGLPSTIHGGQGWKLKNIEDYSHNLNPFGPPECLPEIIEEAIAEIGHYPDDSSINFRKAIAKFYGLNENNIIAGAGSSDIIRMFPNTFLEEGDVVAVFSPSFAEYTQQCIIAGIKVIKIPLEKENDYRIPLNFQIPEGIKAIYICNPNNPTGRIESRERITAIVEECSKKGIYVFLDETLLELVYNWKNITCAKLVEKYDNLVVAGSLTKSFAIPGIRIGYGMCSPVLAKELNKVRMSWNIGAIEQKVGELLVSKHMDYVDNASKILHEANEIMFKSLKEMNLCTKKCDSFFYFCDLENITVQELKERMLSHGYMIRDCSSFGKEYENCIRFCVKDQKRNEGFLKALKKSLE